MGRDLVLARVGGNSLHPCWLDRGRPRDWDLRLVPYQELPPQDGLELSVGPVGPGPKWSGLREALAAWDGWREYDQIWLPDDDIYASQDTITGMFEVARSLGLDLFAPALHESSHYAHYSTMRNHSFHARLTGFVEIMVPGFSVRALEMLLWTLELSDTGWGWGLDSLWPKLLEYRNVGIIDGTPVLHTRPVGQMRDAELARRVTAESDRILLENDCTQVHTVFAGFGPDLAPLELSAEELLVQVVEGWRYLYLRDPRVLSWATDFQRAQFDWVEYPIFGGPTSPESQRPSALA
jgi:hypothetical protein